jgi:hypothetical protein
LQNLDKSIKLFPFGRQKDPRGRVFISKPCLQNDDIFKGNIMSRFFCIVSLFSLILLGCALPTETVEDTPDYGWKGGLPVPKTGSPQVLPQQLKTSSYKFFNNPVNPNVIQKIEKDRIYLGVHYGQDVFSVKAGKVILASRLSGYGQSVMIEHKDGFLSFYGHNSELLVKEGQFVKGGDIIAKSGCSGKIDSSQLLFMMFKDGKVMDPLTYIVR